MKNQDVTSRPTDTGSKDAPWTPGPLRVCTRPLQALTVETEDGSVCVAEVFGTVTSRTIDSEAEANARLIAAAPEMAERGDALNELIERLQKIMRQYLQPDGLSKDAFINLILWELDNPAQWEIQGAWETLLASVKGDAS